MGGIGRSYEKERRANSAESSWPSAGDLQGLRDSLRVDPVTDRAAEWREVSQSYLLDSMEKGHSANAIGETPETAVWNQCARVQPAAQTTGRCLWDMSMSSDYRKLFDGRSKDWPPPACGGPRSCDGSCAGVAVHGLQSWFGSLSGQPCVTGFGRQISGPPIGYLKPGPVWHASARGATVAQSEAMALRALRGVGNARSGQWTERGRAEVVHVRRRLSANEAAIVGEVVDIRGTPEERERLLALVAEASPRISAWVRREYRL
jgi:hypothetical protein